ncbi:18510_t:CDS:2, partial [Gigaspora margarita]
MEASQTVAKIHNGVAGYLQATKFEVNLSLLKQFFKTKILPELHIDQAQTIFLRIAQRELALRKKSLGPELHVSEFFTEEIGRLKDELEEMRVIIQLGAKNNRYWNGEKLLKHIKNAIKIFEQTHPRYVGVWVFNNATSHTIIAPDALVATRINLYP